MSHDLRRRGRARSTAAGGGPPRPRCMPPSDDLGRMTWGARLGADGLAHDAMPTIWAAAGPTGARGVGSDRCKNAFDRGAPAVLHSSTLPCRIISISNSRSPSSKARSRSCATSPASTGSTSPRRSASSRPRWTASCARSTASSRRGRRCRSRATPTGRISPTGRPAVHRVHAARRRPPLRRGRRDRRRPRPARRPRLRRARPREGQRHRRSREAQLRHGQARGLSQGASA